MTAPAVAGFAILLDMAESVTIRGGAWYSASVLVIR